jgi:hypothetical protein
MSGGRGPDDDRQWARAIEKRLRTLENPTSLRCGDWAVNVIDGELVATKPGRAVVLTELLETVELPAGRRVRTVEVRGAPTGGTFVLTFRGRDTIALPYDADAATIKDALVPLFFNYTAIDYDVTGDPGGPWIVSTPAGTLTGNPSGLTGGTGMQIRISSDPPAA